MSEAPCKTLLVILSTLIASSNSHVLQWGSSKAFQPVQGLYVKPSVDGSTGDLYVAASEDEGLKSQWVTDQPVNFLPAGAKQVSPASVAYSSAVSSPANGIVTSHQQSVYTSPTIKYSYTPESTAVGTVAPCPYAGVQTNSVEATPMQYPWTDYYRAQYSLLQYLYPYILQTAAVTASNALKEAGLSDEMTSAILTRSSLWNPSGYSYPVQYAAQNPWNQQSQVVSTPAPAAVPEQTELTTEAKDNKN